MKTNIEILTGDRRQVSKVDRVPASFLSNAAQIYSSRIAQKRLTWGQAGQAGGGSALWMDSFIT